MASISSLPVKTLVKILADLRGGEIGFDPYRDARTSKKENLLAFILAEHTNEQIIASANRVNDIMTLEAASESPWRIDYKDLNGVTGSHQASSLAEADAYIAMHPMYQFTGKVPLAAYKSSASTDMTISLAESARLAAVKALETHHAKQAASVIGASIDPRIAALQALLAPAIDEKQIHAILDTRAQTYIDNILEAVNARLDSFKAPTVVTLQDTATGEFKDLGLQHKHFPMLLKACNARLPDGHRLNIWLKGPAGSGKTTAAHKCADALNLTFRFNGAVSTEYALTGFIDAGGRYHTTAFREAYEHGGVYLFDEVDSSNPNAVLAFNAALANGVCYFPDRIIPRHKNCVIIAGANTTGLGATNEYVGRMKQDAAFLDRFIILEWPLDEALESALTPNTTWLNHVQKLRAKVNERAIKNHMITPRASLYGTALLAAGLDFTSVEAMTLRKGLSQEVWEQLCP